MIPNVKQPFPIVPNPENSSIGYAKNLKMTELEVTKTEKGHVRHAPLGIKGINFSSKST